MTGITEAACPPSRPGVSDAVADAKAAVKVAQSAWAVVHVETGTAGSNRFAPQVVALHQPYNALLVNGVWIVSSTRAGSRTGSPLAEVCKSDGSVNVSVE
ncbi:MAG: hypothetical protein ABIT36_04495 [Steroidobacteraceae bacterium]